MTIGSSRKCSLIHDLTDLNLIATVFVVTSKEQKSKLVIQGTVNCPEEYLQ